MDVSITLTKPFNNRANAFSAIDAIKSQAEDRGWEVEVKTYGKE